MFVEREREIAVCIIPSHWRSAYPTSAHERIGKQVGLTSEEIDRVTFGAEAEGWTDHERALLTAVSELRDNAMISDATWDKLASSYSHAQMLEIPALVGEYQAIAYMQNSARLPVRPSNPGLSAR